MTRARLDLYRAKAEELERLAAAARDERVRWQCEALARAYRVAILVAQGQDLPAVLV
jgi:hypothetical protein